MKYLKSFENRKKFNIGDYVVVKNSHYEGFLRRYVETTVTKIIKIDEPAYFVKYYNLPIGLKFQFFNNEDYFNEYDLRFATPDEIEKYELEKNANRYNL